jgi:hypothetical protein
MLFQSDHTVFHSQFPDILWVISGRNDDTICHEITFHKICWRSIDYIERYFDSDLPDEWRDYIGLNCSLQITECSGITHRVEAICSSCYNFIRNSKRISSEDCEKYMRPIDKRFEHFVIGTFNDERYAFFADSNNGDYFSINAHTDNISNRIYETFAPEEYTRRLYEDRIVAFSQCELIRDVIREIAGLLISL